MSDRVRGSYTVSQVQELSFIYVSQQVNEAAVILSVRWYVLSSFPIHWTGGPFEVEMSLIFSA